MIKTLLLDTSQLGNKSSCLNMGSIFYEVVSERTFADIVAFTPIGPSPI